MADVKATFTGVVASGFDYAGLFGTPGADLSGSAYTAVYVVDESVPSSRAFGPTSSNNLGGPFFVSPYPSAVSSTITIGGVTVAIDGQLGGAVEQDYLPPGGTSPPLAPDALSYQTYSKNPAPLEFRFMDEVIGSATDRFITSPDYRTPLSHTLQPGDFSFGHFTAGVFSPSYANLTLDPRSVTVILTNVTPDPGGVPEPASWATLLVGLFAAGYALRSRRASYRTRTLTARRLRTPV